MKKTLFRIDINWFGDTHRFYRYARSESRALDLGVRALAREVGRSYNSVSTYVHDGHDRYLVQKEPNAPNA